MSECRLRDRSMLTGNRSTFTQTIKIGPIIGLIHSLVFLEHGRHLLSGEEDEMIRQGLVEDGMEEGKAMKASSRIWRIALSGHRKWIVSGEGSGTTVWNRDTRQRVLTVVNEDISVLTVDVSPDSTPSFPNGQFLAMNVCIPHPIQ